MPTQVGSWTDLLKKGRKEGEKLGESMSRLKSTWTAIKGQAGKAHTAPDGTTFILVPSAATAPTRKAKPEGKSRSKGKAKSSCKHVTRRRKRGKKRQASSATSSAPSSAPSLPPGSSPSKEALAQAMETFIAACGACPCCRKKVAAALG